MKTVLGQKGIPSFLQRAYNPKDALILFCARMLISNFEEPELPTTPGC